MTDFRQDFPSDYHVDVDDEMPVGSANHRHFPASGSTSGGLAVSVIPPDGEPWTGTFAFGQLSARAINGVFTCPSPRHLCVVARGEGYVVNVEDPDKVEQVKAAPIMDVRAVVSRGLLVFADPWEIYAYGEHGLVWRTGRIAVEGLAITEVTEDFIRGDCDRLYQEGAGFFVDLDTGTVT